MSINYIEVQADCCNCKEEFYYSYNEDYPERQVYCQDCEKKIYEFKERLFEARRKAPEGITPWVIFQIEKEFFDNAIHNYLFNKGGKEKVRVKEK